MKRLTKKKDKKLALKCLGESGSGRRTYPILFFILFWLFSRKGLLLLYGKREKKKLKKVLTADALKDPYRLQKKKI